MRASGVQPPQEGSRLCVCQLFKGLHWGRKLKEPASSLFENGAQRTQDVEYIQRESGKNMGAEWERYMERVSGRNTWGEKERYRAEWETIQ